MWGHPLDYSVHSFESKNLSQRIRSISNFLSTINLKVKFQTVKKDGFKLRFRIKYRDLHTYFITLGIFTLIEEIFGPLPTTNTRKE